MAKKLVKLTEGDLHRIINEAIGEVKKTSTILSGDRAGETVEYDTEDEYPEIMGRCKLAMDRFSAQMGNLSILAMNSYGAEREDWENSFREAERGLNQIYHKNLLPIYLELEKKGIKPMVNGEPYTDWGFRSAK